MSVRSNPQEKTHRKTAASVTTLLIAGMAGMIALAGVPAAAQETGQERNKNLSVTVAFGAGLNTAQVGNAANHHVLPRNIVVKRGGVVNFVVAGLHQIFVYNPGTRPEDIVVPAAGLYINDYNNLYYLGIDPGGPPTPAPSNPPPSPLPPGVPAIPADSNARNRVESVSFNKVGTYLVICNVTPHFLDGMIAFVYVTR